MLKQTLNRAGRLFRRHSQGYVQVTLPQNVQRTLREVRRRRLTYLGEKRLNQLASTCVEIERLEVPGGIMEIGCALGGSSILLAAAKSPSRPLAIYDVFGMIPPPSEEDGPGVRQRYDVIRSGESKGIGGETYYGYLDDLAGRVKLSFSELGFPADVNKVEFVKGLIEETLEVTAPVALAHVDCDWYEPVSTALERIEPRLSPGGSILVDDYQDWSGCRRAVDEYFAGVDRALYSFDDSAGSLKITKRGQ